MRSEEKVNKKYNKYTEKELLIQSCVSKLNLN